MHELIKPQHVMSAFLPHRPTAWAPSTIVNGVFLKALSTGILTPHVVAVLEHLI